MRLPVRLAAAWLLALLVAVFWFVSSAWKTKPPAKISGAYEALNWWSAQRAYPNAAIPGVAHAAAFEYSQKTFRADLRKTSSAEPWSAIGPHNVGGRTLALAFNPLNPNTIYAGSASGGLWRSFTAGRGALAWERVPTGFPVLGVSSIAIVPDDSNTIYLGTGEVYNYQSVGTGAAFRSTRGSYGIGILKTTDGGVTWSKSLDWSYNQQHGVWAVKINPLNPNTVWAGTTEGAFKSTDAGRSWQQVHDVIMVMDLAINPVDTNIVLIGCGNFASTGHGLYRTTDGGVTWNKITQGVPATFRGKIMLATHEGNSNIAFASFGNGFSGPDGASWLCRTDDAGATWRIMTQQDYSQHQGWFAHDVAVHPTDPNEVFAVGIEIYKSLSGGAALARKSNNASFEGRVPPEGPDGPPEYSHPDHHDVVYHPTNPNVIYFANDGGVFRSVNGGETFESCNGGYQTSQFYNGFACSPLDSLLTIGGFQDNSTAIYDGQLAWIQDLIGGDGGWAAVDAGDPNVVYGSWQFLNLLKSNNRGASWFSISVPSAGGPTSFIAPFVVAVDNPQVLYAGRSVVYISFRGGLGWAPTNGGVPLDGNPVIAMAISRQNGEVVYAATAPQVTQPGVFRTRNAGVSWDNITGFLPNRYPADLAVDPNNDATVYVTFSGFGTSHVFKSTDGGDSWQDIGIGLPDVPASAVVVDPRNPSHVYVGNELGVYVSPDGGSTWQEFYEGLPEAVLVMDLSISPLNRKLRVATHGNGAYERNLFADIPVNVTEGVAVPAGFRLEQNYPNPFNPATTITYHLPHDANISLTIHNITGVEIRRLVDGRQTAGAKTVRWDGRNDFGQAVASGAYFYRLRVGKFEETRKMILAR